ncbi:UNVERIFIED_ORG: hypothetical protein ABIB52_000789 [Arthrobacter sp. UYCu721]
MNILAAVCVIFQLMLLCLLLTGITLIFIVWLFGLLHQATSPRKQRI